MGRTACVVAAVLIGASAVHNPAGGDTRYWQGTTGNWSTPANWFGGEPGSGDAAIIDNGGTACVTQSGEACQFLYLGLSSASASGHIQMSSGALTVAYERIGRDGTGTFTQTGGAHTVTSNLSVGWMAGSHGTYDLNAGSLSAQEIEIGDYDTGTFNWNGGTLDAAIIKVHPHGTMTVGLDWIYDSRLCIYGGSLALGAHYLALQAPGTGAFCYLTSGSLSANSMDLGWYDDEKGSLYQSGGTNTIATNLYMGSRVRAEGHYELSGGALSADGVYVGFNGTGTFLQTGGTNAVGTLFVGNNSGSNGEYQLNGGTLSAQTVYVRSGGAGQGCLSIGAGTLDAQNVSVSANGRIAAWRDWTQGGVLAVHGGGSVDLNAHTLTLEQGGPLAMIATLYAGGSLTAGRLEVAWSPNYQGRFIHFGGTCTVAGSLYAGHHAGSWGRYELQSGGLQVGTSEYIGTYGRGKFTHTGGTNTVHSQLNLGYYPGSEGTYELSGAGALSADYECVGDEGTGTFTQTGGTNTATTLLVGLYGGAVGTYDLSGGGLSAGVIRLGYQGGTGTLNWTGGTLDAAAVHVYANGTMNVGVDWMHDGELHIYGGRVDCRPNKLVLDAPGAGAAGTMSAGALLADWLSIGHSSNGRFTQSGGNNWVDDEFYLGANAGASGTYTLSGGQLSSEDERIGTFGTGAFVQTGGTHFADNCFIGANAGSHGTYALSSGTVWAGNMHVGSSGTGSMSHTGGVRTGPSLYLGYESAGEGTYDLSGTGHLLAGYEYLGFEGTGSLMHTGGTNTVTGRLYLGWWVGSSGTYQLGGTGVLTTPEEYVGRYGTGSFSQTGGTHAVAGNLDIAAELGSHGSYWICGGQLTAAGLRVGCGGQGTLTIATGAPTITVSDLLRLGPRATLSAVPGAVIHMTGSDFENQSTNPPDLAGLAELTLIFEGGTGEVDCFEVAGEDLGAVLTAWGNNFVLGTLQLGGVAPGRIRLVNDSDNHPSVVCPEGQYVYTIVLNAGAAVDLNGLNLYYLNAGGPKQFFNGDANLDGAVGYLDLGVLATHYGQTGTCWPQGDFNGDRVVNFLDLGILATNYGNVTGGAPPVPAPAAAVLLAAGALALLRRRRRS